MTILTPTRPCPPREAPLSRAADHNDPPGPPAAPAQIVLMVDFTSPEGRTWWAVGVGDTLAAAIDFAHDSCPTDTNWQPMRWNDLYGD